MRLLGILFLALMVPSLAYASDPREIKIAGLKNSLSCIQILSNISPFEKQPEIRLVNACSTDLQIKDILIAPRREGKFLSILPLKALRGRPRTSFLQKVELNKSCLISSTPSAKEARPCVHKLRDRDNLTFWLPGDSYFQILLERRSSFKFLVKPEVSVEGKLEDPEPWHSYNHPTP